MSEHLSPRADQVTYTQADANELARRGDEWVSQYAFKKILEYANAAAQAYPVSPNITLIQDICHVMMAPDPQLSDLKIITCETT